jgi:hypothetical protein
MKILYYNSSHSETGNSFFGFVESSCDVNSIAICRDHDDLTRRLCELKQDIALVIIFAADRDDLTKLFLIRELLYDLRLILILPDMDEETVAQGHRLRPRFLSSIHHDFSQAAAVISKMLERLGPSRKTSAFFANEPQPHVLKYGSRNKKTFVT